MIIAQNAALRDQLLHALRGGQSHIEFEAVVKDFPVDLAGVLPHGAPHTAWQLLEHMRIAQHDILEFSRNPSHQSPKWPEGYWPETQTPPTKNAWQDSVTAFKKEWDEMQQLVEDVNQDLYKSIDGGDGQTLLREALVLASHNSYHLGQLMFLKKMLTS